MAKIVGVYLSCQGHLVSRMKIIIRNGIKLHDGRWPLADGR